MRDVLALALLSIWMAQPAAAQSAFDGPKALFPDGTMRAWNLHDGQAWVCFCDALHQPPDNHDHPECPRSYGCALAHGYSVATVKPSAPFPPVPYQVRARAWALVDGAMRWSASYSSGWYGPGATPLGTPSAPEIVPEPEPEP